MNHRRVRTADTVGTAATTSQSRLFVSFPVVIVCYLYSFLFFGFIVIITHTHRAAHPAIYVILHDRYYSPNTTHHFSLFDGLVELISYIIHLLQYIILQQRLQTYTSSRAPDRSSVLTLSYTSAIVTSLPYRDGQASSPPTNFFNLSSPFILIR